MSSISNRPAKRSDQIHELITSVNRYNPENISVLEDYLKEQCNSFSSDSNDLAANLALLKLYQFNPDLINIDAVVSVLAKALTSLPGNDFIMCLYLLNEQIINDESVLKVLELKDLLETARFEIFWDVLSTDQARDLISNVRGFDDTIRSMIATNIANTHQSATAEFLELSLNLDNSELVEFAEQQGWSLSSDNRLVNFPLRDENLAKPIVLSEQTPFSQLTKAIGSSFEN
ncbi:Eukaryotic translation initiation factor 3 subunit K [Smittium culicis]|uniref:Eukaryotic translation initiation factor 3 subunit K n=1 Tax=Smittium culicis TaxID=133412 RepID=A0A1R1YRU8_9FUNG|nr:Eukaryotic translation initiation factor 3 subunit K [Smittium culicis]